MLVIATSPPSGMKLSNIASTAPSDDAVLTADTVLGRGTTVIDNEVERILRERLSWVTEVVGGIDDSMSMDESSALGSGGYVPNF